MVVEQQIREKLKHGKVVKIEGGAKITGGYVILIAETDEREYPNYWAGTEARGKTALKRAKGFLDPDTSFVGYDQCEGEHPCKVIVAKVIAEFWRESIDRDEE